VVRVTEHLKRPPLFPLAANDVMLDRIGRALNEGLPLTERQINFMRHELIEAELMDRGMSYDEAHSEALKSHPPGQNYDLDVIDKDTSFGSWWRRVNGLGPR
jgi:hypothetical protein